MPLRAVCAIAFILSVAAPALAQEWIEFVSREDRFTANFPGQPTVTQTTYKSQFGADLPGTRLQRPAGREPLYVDRGGLHEHRKNPHREGEVMSRRRRNVPRRRNVRPVPATRELTSLAR